VTKASMQNSEQEHQRKLLLAKVGEPGSGSTRYAAAMFFYQANMISAELLEIYRRCSKFDAEDPIDVAKYEGIDVSEFALGFI
jgi:hypothetical protein